MDPHLTVNFIIKATNSSVTVSSCNSRTQHISVLCVSLKQAWEGRAILGTVWVLGVKGSRPHFPVVK